MKTNLSDVKLEGAYMGKPVYALCRINKQRKTLKASHYAFVAFGGNEPVWSIYTMKGTFQRFVTTRQGVKQFYPNHVWRRMSAVVAIDNVENRTVQQELQALRDQYASLGEAAKRGTKVKTKTSPKNKKNAPTLELVPQPIEAKQEGRAA